MQYSIGRTKKKFPAQRLPGFDFRPRGKGQTPQWPTATFVPMPASLSATIPRLPACCSTRGKRPIPGVRGQPILSQRPFAVRLLHWPTVHSRTNRSDVTDHSESKMRGLRAARVSDHHLYHRHDACLVMGSDQANPPPSWAAAPAKPTPCLQTHLPRWAGTRRGRSHPFIRYHPRTRLGPFWRHLL